MDHQTIVFSLLILLVSANIAAELNDTIESITEEALREPRANKRIVKLYSGIKPDPVVCSGEGFQADPKNCAIFYRCMKSGNGKYTVFRFECGPGTVYDPETEVCNHPQSTKRVGCGGVLDTLPTDSNNLNEIDDSQSELPSPIQTSKPVYTSKPAYSSTISSNPPTNKISSIDALASTRPTTTYVWNTSKKQSHTKSPQETSTIPGLSTNNSAEYVWGSFISSTKYKETSVTPSAQSENECSSDGFMGDTENCRKFYRCVGNQRGSYMKYEFSCSESTIWDDEIQSCNHPWAVKRSKCGRSKNNNFLGSIHISTTAPLNIAKTTSSIQESAPSKNNKTIQQQTQISYGDKVTQMQTQIANGPVIQNQTQINYGDRLNQTKTLRVKQNQTQLSHGSAISQTQTQINYGTQGIQTQLQIDHSQQSSQSQTQLHETTKTTPKYSSDDVKSTTQTNQNNENMCSKSGFMGDIHDCKIFYRCVDNGQGSYTRYEFSCGEGTVWDSKLEACNHAWAVESCGGKEPVEQEILKTSTMVTQKETVSTHNYYTTTIKSTPTYAGAEPINIEESDIDDIGYGNANQLQQQNTTYFSTTNRPVDVTQSTQEKMKCRSSGFTGDTMDCSIFYRCVDDGKGGFTQHEFKCGEGTLWDSEIEACNHAGAVKTCGSYVSNNASLSTTSNQENTIITTSTPITTSSQTSVEAVPNNEDYLDTGYEPSKEETLHSSTTTTDQPQNHDTKEKLCRTSGFIGDDKDCKKFYRCIENGNGTFIKYEFTCGEGTVWDPKIEACNHAWAVENCGGGIATVSQHQDSSTEIHTTTITEPSTESHKSTEKNTNSPSTDLLLTTTIATTVENNQCKSSGFMGDEKDCKKFYRCVDNGNGLYTRYEFSCGEGTVWDPKIDACNHAWAVEKCGGTVENLNDNVETSSHSPPLNDEVLPQTTQHNSNDIDITTQSTTIVSETATNTNSVNCKNTGFIGDPDDCKKFYRCVDNGLNGFMKYEFVCGEGTVWDQSLESCNHAWLVKDCGKSNQSQPSQVSSTTPTAITTENLEVHPQSTDSPSEYPHEDSNNSNVCTNEGFIGDKNNCKKFYRCVDNQKGGFIVYEFSCGEGTAWDPEINACNHINDANQCYVTSSTQNVESTSKASTVGIVSTTQSTQYTQSNEDHKQTTNAQPTSNKECIQDGFMADDRDCRKFYRCVDNGQGGYIKYEFVCGEGTVWVQDYQACDHPSSDHICESGTKEPHNPIHEHDEMGTTTDKISTTTVGKNYSSNPTPQPSSFSCESEGFYGDPHSCKVFHRCVDNNNGGFTKYDFICGDGTVWDQELQTCDYESDTKNCSYNNSNSSQVTQPQENNNIINTTPETAEGKPTTVGQDDSNSINEDKCTSEGFFANTNDCSKFYRCVMNENGGYIKYDFSCGEGTVWVQDLSACDYDNGISSCSKHNGPAVAQTTEGYQPSSTFSSTKTSSGQTTPQTSLSDHQNDGQSETEAICDSEGFFADKKDCKRFYRCVSNGQGGFTKYDFVCGEGTAWDSDMQTCNHISEVDSCKGNITEVEHHSTMHDEPVSQSTQASTTTTTIASSTTNTMVTSNNDACVDEGYFGNTNDCTKFYRCVDNGNGGFTKYDFSCGEGTIWDQDITTCNHPEDVTNPSCKEQQQESSTAMTSSSSSSSTSQYTTESSSQNSNNCSQDQTSKKPVNKDIKCDKAGYFADPNDCKKFYRCVDWNSDGKKFSVYHFECGEGTIWDPALDTCNHEDSVYPPRDCSGAQSQNENITENSSTTTIASEETTTQESTTSEQTTTQNSTSSEPTTTQKTTTSEVTTTQQPTTSELTTTQQSTTSEVTTTQQSTTSEATTTQQSTTSELTTTPQSTASETTTTQKSTTSEQTTQQSTTNEPTTTQQSTTNEPTTTNNAQSTTEQTTTSEQTTTQPPTSETTTSQQQTTTEQTTQQPTTDQNEIATAEPINTTETTENQSTTETTTTDSSSEQTSTTTESSTTEQTTEGTPTTESNSTKECPETDNDQYLFVCPTSFRRHPKYCNMFYQCIENDDTHEPTIAVFSCPNNTIYDESQTKCVEKEKSEQNCEGEIAQRRKRLYASYREPIVVGTESQGCPSSGYLPFEKESECSPAFLKCQKNKLGKLRGFVYKCPEGYIYWSISKRCELMDEIRDCKRSSTDWSRRWEIPIETVNISRNSRRNV